MVQGINQHEIVPALPGYFIGSLVRKIELDQNKLISRRSELQAKLDAAYEKHRGIRTSSEFLNAATNDEKQKLFNDSTTKLNIIRNEILSTTTDLDDLNQMSKVEQECSSMVPLESSCKFEIVNNGDVTERTLNVHLSSRENIESDVKKLLISLDDRICPIFYATDSLKAIVSIVEGVLEKGNPIILFGSFVNLARIRRLEPFIVKATAINEPLRKLSKRYNVLSEATLGGLLLGIGRITSDPPDSTEAKDLLSKVQTVYSIGFGTTTNSHQTENQNLWDHYQDWKKFLINDRCAGIPLEYRYRDFEAVLNTNKNTEQSPPSLTNPPAPTSTSSLNSGFPDNELTPWDTVMPFIPNNGIRKGLKNIINSCWLNSALKFISCHNFYDRMVKVPCTDERKKFHLYFREIIFRLRNGRDVPESLIRSLAEEIGSRLPKFAPSMLIQHDSREFLLTVLDLLKWNPAFPTPEERTGFQAENIYPRVARIYHPKTILPAGWGKTLVHDQYKTHIDFSLTEEHFSGQLPIDLSLLSEQEEECEVRLDRLEPDAEDITSRKDYKFRSKMFFTNLPDTVMIQLNRGKINGRESVKNNQSIRLLPNNQIVLRKFKIETENFGELKNKKLVFDELCVYRIGAAIIHLGGSGSGGHYICHERSADGTLIEHSDERISTGINESGFGVNGDFLRLDKIKNIELGIKPEDSAEIPFFEAFFTKLKKNDKFTIGIASGQSAVGLPAGCYTLLREQREVELLRGPVREIELENGEGKVFVLKIYYEGEISSKDISLDKINRVTIETWSDEVGDYRTLGNFTPFLLHLSYVIKPYKVALETFFEDSGSYEQLRVIRSNMFIPDNIEFLNTSLHSLMNNRSDNIFGKLSPVLQEMLKTIARDFEDKFRDRLPLADLLKHFLEEFNLVRFVNFDPNSALLHPPVGVIRKSYQELLLRPFSSQMQKAVEASLKAWGILLKDYLEFDSSDSEMLELDRDKQKKLLKILQSETKRRKIQDQDLSLYLHSTKLILSNFENEPLKAKELQQQAANETRSRVKKLSSYQEKLDLLITELREDIRYPEELLKSYRESRNELDMKIISLSEGSNGAAKSDQLKELEKMKSELLLQISEKSKWLEEYQYLLTEANTELTELSSRIETYNLGLEEEQLETILEQRKIEIEEAEHNQVATSFTKLEEMIVTTQNRILYLREKPSSQEKGYLAFAIKSRLETLKALRDIATLLILREEPQLVNPSSTAEACMQFIKVYDRHIKNLESQCGNDLKLLNKFHQSSFSSELEEKKR